MLDLYDLTILWEDELGPEGWLGEARKELVFYYTQYSRDKKYCGQPLRDINNHIKFCTRFLGHQGDCKSVRLKLISVTNDLKEFRYTVELVDGLLDPEEIPLKNSVLRVW